MQNKKSIRYNSKLAYLVGVALGDGNLSNPNGRAVRLRITCDLKYPRLVEKIKETIKAVLPENKVSTVRRPKNCLDISSYSNYWDKVLGWKAGGGSKYLQKANIPSWIHSKRTYKINCIKGLIETDGSIYSDRGYNAVMFVTIIPQLARSVYQIIKELGFKPHLYRIGKKEGRAGNKQILFHIRLSKDINKFLNLVKPVKA